jgi:hypothetical protein
MIVPDNNFALGEPALELRYLPFLRAAVHRLSPPVTFSDLVSDTHAPASSKGMLEDCALQSAVIEIRAHAAHAFECEIEQVG